MRPADSSLNFDKIYVSGTTYTPWCGTTATAIEEDKEFLARIIKSQRKLPYSLTIETIKDNVVYTRSIWGGHIEYRRTDNIVEFKDPKTDEVKQVPQYELNVEK